MGRRNDYTVIGAFVLGALVLLVAALLVFGSGSLFRKKARFVVHFTDPLKGLEIGAPVLYRGVRIGDVRKVSVSADLATMKSHSTVQIELYPDLLTFKSQGDNLEEALPNLIKAGVRAQLRVDSMVTGRRYIEITVRPDTEPVLLNLQTECGEIPSIPSELDRLTRALETIDIPQATERLISVLNGLDRLLNSNNVAASVADLPEVLAAIRSAITCFTTQTATAVSRLDTMAVEYTALARTATVVAASLAPQASSTLDDARAALAKFERTMDDLDSMVAADAPGRARLDESLRELSATITSLREFVEYIERHPQALLKGRTPTKEQ